MNAMHLRAKFSHDNLYTASICQITIRRHKCCLYGDQACNAGNLNAGQAHWMWPMTPTPNLSVATKIGAGYVRACPGCTRLSLPRAAMADTSDDSSAISAVAALWSREPETGAPAATTGAPTCIPPEFHIQDEDGRPVWPPAQYAEAASGASESSALLLAWWAHMLQAIASDTSVPARQADSALKVAAYRVAHFSPGARSQGDIEEAVASAHDVAVGRPGAAQAMRARYLASTAAAPTAQPCLPGAGPDDAIFAPSTAALLREIRQHRALVEAKRANALIRRSKSILGDSSGLSSTATEPENISGSALDIDSYVRATGVHAMPIHDEAAELAAKAAAARDEAAASESKAAAPREIASPAVASLLDALRSSHVRSTRHLGPRGTATKSAATSRTPASMLQMLADAERQSMDVATAQNEAAAQLIFAARHEIINRWAASGESTAADAELYAELTDATAALQAAHAAALSSERDAWADLCASGTAQRDALL